MLNATFKISSATAHVFVIRLPVKFHQYRSGYLECFFPIIPAQKPNTSDKGQAKDHWINNGPVPLPLTYTCQLLPPLTRAVTECDLILPPALKQKVVFCTQKDTQTHGQTEREADSIILPKTFVLQGVL